MVTKVLADTSETRSRLKNKRAVKVIVLFMASPFKSMKYVRSKYKE
jgi:hypothetical protein